MKKIVSLVLGLGLLVALPATQLPAQDLQAQLDELQQRVADLESQSAVASGREIYNVACATCHGYNGDGNGPESDGFVQPPTDFTQGTFVFRSTLSEIPAPGDLERSIREGMPGTEMVPFKNVLTPASIKAVAAYILTFNDKFGPGDVPSEEDEVALPDERPFPRSAESIARGKQVWADFGCADCHGERGQGLPAEDDWGRNVHMIDFSLGYYKSGIENVDFDLYRSIATGMYGTTMPAFAEDAKPAEIWALVDYIRSLAKKRGFFGWVFSEQPSGFDYSNY